MGLIVLLPVIGLVVISRALLGLLALMLVAAASAFLAATFADDIGLATTHTASRSTSTSPPSCSRRSWPSGREAHARLILGA